MRNTYRLDGLDGTGRHPRIGRLRGRLLEEKIGACHKANPEGKKEGEILHKWWGRASSSASRSAIPAICSRKGIFTTATSHKVNGPSIVDTITYIIIINEPSPPVPCYSGLMLNRRTLSARMAMGLIFMTSARTDAADAGGGGGVPLGGGGNGPDPIRFIYEVVHGTSGLISKIVDENHKINAAEATRRGALLQSDRNNELLGLANKGNAEAQNELGFNYFHGVGVSRDRAQAAYWYRQAANQGLPSAQNNLGLYYNNHDAGQDDPIEACALWRLAAPTFPKAQINLSFVVEESRKTLSSVEFTTFSASVEKRYQELRKAIAITNAVVPRK